MKNLALFLLVLSLFAACKQKEEQKPVNPTKWLSQIKNEEAKKRTVDVLEKIYISTAYSIAEKDSLSEMQVKFANCELYDSTKDIRMFNGWKAESSFDRNEGRGKNVYDLLSFYGKDTAVFKAALNVILDTSFLYIGNTLHPSYYQRRTNNTLKLSTSKPTKELLDKEQEVVTLIDSSRNINYKDSEKEINQKKKIRNLASEKLFQFLKEPAAYDYVSPKLDQKLTVLYSPNKTFRVFYFTYFNDMGDAYGGDYAADVYIQYRKSESDKLITGQIKCREVNGESYCFAHVPSQIFQVEKNGNPVFIFLNEYNGSMGGERYGILKAIEIKDEKVIPCKDCIEGEELKIYHRSTKRGSSPIFDAKKQQLSLISLPFIHTNLNLTVIKRYVLQWNGQQLVSIPLKLYCEE